MSELTAKELFDKLSYKKKNVFEASSPEQIKKIYDYSVGYMKYLDDAKTAREAADTTVAMLEANGYTEYKFGDKLSPRDKRYFNQKGKSINYSCYKGTCHYSRVTAYLFCKDGKHTANDLGNKNRCQQRKANNSRNSKTDLINKKKLCKINNGQSKTAK